MSVTHDFQRAASGVPGLATQRHAQLMYGLCKWLNVRHAVEVGPYKGGSSVWIARAIKENGGGKLWLIDDFSLGSAQVELEGNLRKANVLDVCEVVRADSQKMETFPPCEFAFIDGDHSLAGCIRDITKAVFAGARCICIHDTVSWWGPREVADTHRTGMPAFPDFDMIEANHDEGFAVLLKREDKPPVHFTEKDWPKGCI